MTTSAHDVQNSILQALESVRYWTSQLILDGDIAHAETGIGLVRLIEEEVIPRAEQMGLTAFEEHPASKKDVFAAEHQLQSESISFSSSDADNKKAPFFFIFNNRLVKIGKASSKKSGFYKKTIPLPKARQIMNVLERLLKNKDIAFTPKQLIEFCNSMHCIDGKCPDYHIHLVLGALEKAGVLQKKDSRSLYEFADGPLNVDTWVRAIEKLKERSDLYNVAE